MLHSTSQRTLGFSRLKILFDNCAGLEPACVPRNRYTFPLFISRLNPNLALKGLQR
jgi:hypothetical protein